MCSETKAIGHKITSVLIAISSITSSPARTNAMTEGRYDFCKVDLYKRPFRRG